MISTKRGLIVAVVFLASLAPAAGYAQSAEELIIQGVQMREQGRDEEALQLFRRAHEAEPSGRTLAQMGLAEQALGSWVEAYEHLMEALARPDAWVERNRQPLEGALETVRQNVGRLELRGGVDGAEVWINGRSVGRLPIAEPVAVRAGQVQLIVRASGYVPVQRTIAVNAGSLARETVSMAPDPHGTSQGTVATPTGTDPISTGGQPTAGTEESGSVLPWILVGTGGAIALSAIAPYALHFSKASQYNDDSQCLVAGSTRDEQCGDIRDAAERNALIAGILLGVGAATAGVGLILHFVGRGSSTERETARVVCGSGPGDVGAACTLQF